MLGGRWWGSWSVVVSVVALGCGSPGGQDSASVGDTEADTEGDTETDTEGDTDGDELEIVRSDEPRDLAPNPTDEERASDRSGAVGFTSALFGEISDLEDNVVFSPHSIRMAFAQVHLGTNGAVKSEIESVLGFGAGDRTPVVLNALDLDLASRNFAGDGNDELEEGEQPPLDLVVANSLFADHGFADSVNADFLDALAINYDAGIRIVPFDTDVELGRQLVNGWVAEQTRDKIPELIKGLPSSVELIVVNTLYFKASWQAPFEESATAKAPFTTRAGTSVEVDTMNATLLQADYAAVESEWEAIALPYSDGRLQMVVIVPSDPAAFEDGLDGEGLTAIFAALAPSVIDLALPKCQVRSPFSVRGPLETVGMTAPFNDVSGFSGIPTGNPIVDVVHETFIAVDEKGTEAAAATAIIFGDSGEPTESEHVVAVDRTFYLAIRDRSAETVLFFGRIDDPSQIED